MAKLKHHELIASINSKSTRNGLHSLKYTMVYDSAKSKGENQVDYSKTGSIVTEMPGHLMKYRVKSTSHPNLYSLYVGNIYPSIHEIKKFESSGFQISEEQANREFEFAKGAYSNLTEDEENLLAEKIEVYTLIDKKTAEFLLTRQKGQRIIVAGRYDFSRPEYSIIPPSSNTSRRRVTTAKSAGNENWDKIKLNLMNPYFLQADVKGDNISYIDITKTINTATFSLELKRIAAKYNTTVKWSDVNQLKAYFDNKMSYSTSNNYTILKHEKEVIPTSDFSRDIAIGLSEYQTYLKDVIQKDYNIVIPKSRKEGIIISTSVKSKRHKFVREVSNTQDDKKFFVEYFGTVKIPRDIKVLNKDDKIVYKWWDDEIAVKGNGPDAKPYTNKKNEDDISEQHSTHLSVIRYSFDIDTDFYINKDTDKKNYVINGKKFRAPIFFT